MTMNTWGNETLLTEYALALQTIEQARYQAGLYEQEIMRRMREQGAIAIPSETYTCELVTTPKLDFSRLTSLKEKLLPADLEKVWEPEHWVTEEKHYPESWNGVKLNALARRYGGQVARIVEEAKVAGTPRLKFTRKGE